MSHQLQENQFILIKAVFNRTVLDDLCTQLISVEI